MPWLQLKLNSQPEQAQAIAELLSDAGAAAVTFQDAQDQPLYEPAPGSTPLWEHTEVTGLFPADTDMGALKVQLQQRYGKQFANWHIQPLEEKDWARAWMDDFHPMQFGKRLWICPGWHTPPQPDAVNILLDPGLAFGTGTHPTTALCLEWLDAHPPAELNVIDYGCGSGILSLAAAKLGAMQVQAIDNDPQALQATCDNADRNRLKEKIAVFLPEESYPAPCDLLIANILASPLINLATRLSELVTPGGTIILSGILADQATEVTEAYKPWFSMANLQESDGWVRLEGCRKPAGV